VHEQIHFACQYLAAAGKSLLEPKADDSHTNVRFNRSENTFETWELGPEGIKLGLDLNDFSLKWAKNELRLPLNGKKHSEVLDWLKTSSKKLNFSNHYSFDLHYDLPFHWSDGYSFNVDVEVLNQEIRLRTFANKILETFLKVQNLTSDIRIWPHHFDTGAFVVLDENTEKSIGLGMAIPDTLMKDHYFYLSGYNGHDSIETTDFKTLSLGEWKNNGFKGAIFSTSKVNEVQALQFLKEAFSQYLS
jgi:hypothetical protein